MDFWVKEVTVIKVKSLDYVSVEFPTVNGIPTPWLLYGSNGVGKTTLLEAISLIGHLPCMSQIAGYDEFTSKNSYLVEHLNNDREESARITAPKFDIESVFLDKQIPSTPEGWMNLIQVREGYRFGAVFFSTVFGDKDLDFCVLIDHQDGINRKGEPRTLTSLLSQEEFSDIDFAANACLVTADKKMQSRLTQLLPRLFFGRTYYLSSAGDGLYDPIDSLSTDSHYRTRSEQIFVSYVNTDLNDFGRGNDLRESPKALNRDFFPQMRKRLRIDFDDRTRELSCLQELNRGLIQSFSCSEKTLFGNSAVDSTIRIQECILDYSEDGEEAGIRLYAQRGEDVREVPL